MAYPQNSMLENTPLGMYFQGQSIGDEQRKNREASEKHALQYLMDQLTSGDKLNTSHLEGNRAAAMNTPDMLDWYTNGYRGQMQSQDAAGQFAAHTLANKIRLGNQEYKEKYAKGQIGEQESNYQLERIKQALSGQGPAQQESAGQIGFEMQPPMVDPSTFNYGNEGRAIPILKTEAAMKASMGNDYRTGSKPYDLETIDKEIARTKDSKALALLQKERARIQQELAAGGGGTGTPNMGAMPSNTSLMSNFSQGSTSTSSNPWLQGVNTTDPKHQNVMGAFMDTPEFRQKMAGMEHKTDAQLEQQQLRLQAMKDMQEARKTINEPKYKEQLAAAIQTLSNPNADPAARAKAQMFFNYHQQLVTAAAPANWKQTPDMTQFGIQTNPSAVQQTQVTTQAPATPQQKADPLGIR